VIATGPKLAFDEVEGLGPTGHTQSICHVDHASGSRKKPGRNSSRIRVLWLWVQCKWLPATALLMNLPRSWTPICVAAKIRDKGADDLRHRQSPTSATSASVVWGDSERMSESALRSRHIKWICNAKTTKVEAGKMYVTGA